MRLAALGAAAALMVAGVGEVTAADGAQRGAAPVKHGAAPAKRGGKVVRIVRCAKPARSRAVSGTTRRAGALTRRRCARRGLGRPPVPAAAAPAPAAPDAGPAVGTAAPAATPAPTPAAGPPPPPPPPPPADDPRSLQVRGGEFFLTLSQPSVSAGDVRVEFNLETAEDPHDLWLAREEGGPATGFAEQPAGSVTTRTVELQAGSYALFCALPDHFALGMSATLRVR
jgi:hypothetical protein